MNSGESKINILFVEDNVADIWLLKDTVTQNFPNVNFISIKDGAETIPYLKKQGNYADAVTPNLIFMDLNLPKLSGTEVLSAIKSDKSISFIPVIVLTTSQNPADVKACYSLGANGFLVKSYILDEFVDTIISSIRYWLNYALLPETEDQKFDL